MAQHYLCVPFLSNFGQFGVILMQFEPLWSILDNFFTTSLELINKEQRWKQDSEYKMSAQLVQENHQEKFKPILFPFTMLLYFLSIYMTHPVDITFIIFRNTFYTSKVWNVLNTLNVDFRVIWNIFPSLTSFNLAVSKLI